MTVLGIVGSEAKKFTRVTERAARLQIQRLILAPDVTRVVSGGCHLGGIDIWTREECHNLRIPFDEFAPLNRNWGGPGGFKERNLGIAAASDKVVCITLRELPAGYRGMKFDWCYHCKTGAHVKSGGCWTMKQAIRLGKQGELIVI